MSYDWAVVAGVAAATLVGSGFTLLMLATLRIKPRPATPRPVSAPEPALTADEVIKFQLMEDAEHDQMMEALEELREDVENSDDEVLKEKMRPIIEKLQKGFSMVNEGQREMSELLAGASPQEMN